MRRSSVVKFALLLLCAASNTSIAADRYEIFSDMGKDDWSFDDSDCKVVATGKFRCVRQGRGLVLAENTDVSTKNGMTRWRNLVSVSSIEVRLWELRKHYYWTQIYLAVDRDTNEINVRHRELDEATCTIEFEPEKRGKYTLRDIREYRLLPRLKEKLTLKPEASETESEEFGKISLSAMGDTNFRVSFRKAQINIGLRGLALETQDTEDYVRLVSPSCQESPAVLMPSVFNPYGREILVDRFGVELVNNATGEVEGSCEIQTVFSVADAECIKLD